MKNRLPQKTNIVKLLRRYPKKHRYQYLARDLAISTRYVRLLEKGRAPGIHLRQAIKNLLEQSPT